MGVGFIVLTRFYMTLELMKEGGNTTHDGTIFWELPSFVPQKSIAILEEVICIR